MKCYTNKVRNQQRGFNMFNKKRAFTLAEVLIAMTIIGVVAALTIPALMSNTTAKTNRLKIQKAYAQFANALRVAEMTLNYNTADINQYHGLDSELFTMEKIMTKTMNATQTLYEDYTLTGKPITPNANSISTSTYGTDVSLRLNGTQSVIGFKTKDNVHYIFTYSADESLNCTKDNLCVGYIDTNGPNQGPNEIITCTSGTEQYPYYDTTNNVLITPAECTVDPSAITDIYPFIMYGATVAPGNNAFDTVLTTEVTK